MQQVNVKSRVAENGASEDPVCGMGVDPATATHSAEHDGETYYFCCAGCREKFVADPGRYFKPRDAASHDHTAHRGHEAHGHEAHGHGGAVRAAASADAVYTCPMHPEVRQIGPGPCPICGMALEPLTVTAEAGRTKS